MDYSVDCKLEMYKFNEARKREKLFVKNSYIYVMIANTDQEEKLEGKDKTHIKIGRSKNPINRCNELQNNLLKKNDHVHPRGIKSLDLWFITYGGVSAEKLLRTSIAERWTPYAQKGEYITYKGYWEDWIDDFEQFFEEELELVNHKILEAIIRKTGTAPDTKALKEIFPSDESLKCFFKNIQENEEFIKSNEFIGELERGILVDTYAQQVLSKRRPAIGGSNSSESKAT